MQIDTRAELTAAASLGFIDKDFLLSLCRCPTHFHDPLCPSRLLHQIAALHLHLSPTFSVSGCHHVSQTSLGFIQTQVYKTQMLSAWRVTSDLLDPEFPREIYFKIFKVEGGGRGGGEKERENMNRR